MPPGLILSLAGGVVCRFFYMGRLLSGRAFQGGEHELPVFLNARDVAAFVGRVWRAERWAEAHHVHRMPSADDAAFQ